MFWRQAGIFLSVGHYVAVTLGDFESISDRFCPVWTEPLCFGNDFVFISNKPSANVWPSCFNSLNTLRGSVYKLQRHRLNSGWHLYYLSFSSFSLFYFILSLSAGIKLKCLFLKLLSKSLTLIKMWMTRLTTTELILWKHWNFYFIVIIVWLVITLQYCFFVCLVFLTLHIFFTLNTWIYF